MAEKQEWELSSLKDAGVVLIDCDHRTPPAVETGYPYIAIPQLKNGRIDLSGVRKISPTHFEEWTRKANPQHYDVILSRRCNPGETAYVPPNLKCALGQNLVLLRADGKKVLQQYLRWITQGPLWWEQISKFINVGAVFDSLRCADIPKFELPLPPISEQHAIAAVLEALDDKIELNQRMNNTLEGIAEALFKSWFVDFDPVKAKAEGREPEGMNDAIADLFPSTFTETISGPIPEGWEISEIGKEVEVVGGSTPRTHEAAYWEDGRFYWATPKDLSKLKSPILLDTERKITGFGVKQINSGQLPIDTILLSSRAPVGYIALAKVPVSINQGFIAMKCTKKLSPYYVINWTYSALEEIKARATGTTFAEISKSVFRPIKVIVPNESMIQRFNDIAKPIYDRIATNERNISFLINTRDLLLPRLVSGKLWVSEISETMEALAL